MRKLLVSLVAAVALLVVSHDSSGQSGRRVFLYGGSETLRSASGDLTAAETTSAVSSAFAVDVVVYLDITKITTPDVDDEVDWYIQTTYDGSNWVDLANIHVAQAENGTTETWVIQLGPAAAVDSSTTPTAPKDGTLTDDTQSGLPVGLSLRIKTAVAGASAPTYAYSASVFMR